MRITRMSMVNVRCFDIFGPITPGNINIFVGKNNSGKSTVLKSIYSIQNRSVLRRADERLGSNGQNPEIFFNVEELNYYDNIVHKISVSLLNERTIFDTLSKKIEFRNSEVTLDYEPNSFIYPCFTSRISENHNTSVGEEAATSITGDNEFLPAKIDALVSKQYSRSSKFRLYCNQLFGFSISTKSKGEGKHVVRYIDDDFDIPLSSMGDGISSLLKTITYLCTIKDKVILIEEPENDLHPTLLKKFLKILIDESQNNNNQVFITTHSNIVLQTLGSQPDSKVYHVYKKTPDTIISKIEEIPQNETKNRLQILSDLGYDFSDYNLWSGWLFLEESSAEQLIRDHFIRWYCPKLSNKLRTFSAAGINKIEQKFNDYNNLFVFTHLEPTYKNKAWVVIDGGKTETGIIEEFKSKYSNNGWHENRFRNFSKHNFEEYYPDYFKDDIKDAFANKEDKKRKKEILFKKVLDWIKDDDQQAKIEFQKSAKEVIDILKEIEKEIT